MPERIAEWGDRRPPARVLHLDSAAAGRPSCSTLDAVAAHARLEAELGAYVAQEAAADVLDRLRVDVAGLLGVPADGVAFLESATTALVALLGAWPLAPGARIGVAPAEWGPNVEQFARHGYEPQLLPTDATGRLDLDAFERTLDADPPAVVHLTQVASHRGLVQPVAEAARRCRAAGVPLWVDAAQAVGHADAATGADAVYGTSRKWLTGPRGVGFLGVGERYWETLDVLRPRMLGDDHPPVRYLESHEAHVPGRIGLATAVRELLTDGPSRIWARLAEVGRATRSALADVPGWLVVDPTDVPSAITALRPAAGQDVFAERARLLADHGILTTAERVARAPRDLPEPLLRVSPHVDVTPEQLDRLARALAQ
jgi:pyridoxal 5-phosphate dependent beta-lyase